MIKKRLAYNTDDTIASISTPQGESGIGIVRLSGKSVFAILNKVFVSKTKKKPSSFKTHTVHYGNIVDKNDLIDEVILTVMRKPKSYTKEDTAEINCHGGVIPLRKVLNLLLEKGARLAEPGEFTKRAFLNGRIDLAQAEAVCDIIRAKTDSSMKVSLEQLEGEFSKKIRSLKNVLLNVLSEVEASIDFSEEDIKLISKKAIIKKLKKTLNTIREFIDNAWRGMILKEGVLCVICGKPNVGKSSLMNAFLRRNRVIVTPVAGTTRDAIEEVVNLGDVPVRVVDTAGIAKAQDIVEEHGIKRSKSYIKSADLILFMLDLSKPWSKEDKNILSKIKEKHFIIIANKSDLKRKLDLSKLKNNLKENEIIDVSLLRKKNIGKLEKAILKRIWHGNISQREGAFVTNLRHKKDLKASEKHLNKTIRLLAREVPAHPEILAHEIREAASYLGSILGDTIEPDILDRIFSKFCIGK